MSVRVATWNVKNSFEYPDNVRLYDHAMRMDADVLVFQEAYEDDNHHAHELRERFYHHGYAVQHMPYEPASSEIANHRFVLLARPEQRIKNAARLGVLNAVQLELIDPDTEGHAQAMGVHFDSHSEANRLAQVDALAEHDFTDGPRILLGDLNSIVAGSLWARILRSRGARAAAERMPSPRARSIATRLSEMALGTTLQKLADDYDLHDVTKRPRITWPTPVSFVALDHILTSPDITVDNVAVQPPTRLSDHRALLADLTIGA